MKLSDYAKLKGVTYRTAWNWFNAGKIPNAEQMDGGTIIVNSNLKVGKAKNIVLYARVSTYPKKADLERQMERLRSYANANGYIIKREYKEIASGMNDNRRLLNKILMDQDAQTIIVEHKDRLTRFGFNYIKNLLALQDRHVLVINEENNADDDLMRDFVAIITSFCFRLYGMRRGLNKSKNLKTELASTQE